MLDALTGWLARENAPEVSRPDPRPDDLDPVLDFGDRCFVLKQWRRREVLRLIDVNGPMSLSDLAEAVACREYDVPLGLLTNKQRKRVYVSLLQTHCPTLDRHEAVVFHKDRGAVEPGPAFDELVAMLPEE